MKPLKFFFPIQKLTLQTLSVAQLHRVEEVLTLLFPGLATRTLTEARRNGCHLKVANPTGQRTNLAYSGVQSMIERIDILNNVLCAKETYDEYGPDLIAERFATNGFLANC
jgi:hypothetical protein